MGILCLIHVLVKAFSPGTILSPIGIPFFVAVSVTALVLECYLVGSVHREWLVSVIFAGATFTFLPVFAGWSIDLPLWKLFIAGMFVFGVTDVLYRSIGKRMSSGPSSKLAPFANGLILYLASQCFQGLL